MKNLSRIFAGALVVLMISVAGLPAAFAQDANTDGNPISYKEKLTNRITNYLPTLEGKIKKLEASEIPNEKKSELLEKLTNLHTRLTNYLNDLNEADTVEEFNALREAFRENRTQRFNELKQNVTDRLEKVTDTLNERRGKIMNNENLSNTQKNELLKKFDNALEKAKNHKGKVQNLKKGVKKIKPSNAQPANAVPVE